MSSGPVQPGFKVKHAPQGLILQGTMHIIYSSNKYLHFNILSESSINVLEQMVHGYTIHTPFAMILFQAFSRVFLVSGLS